MIASFLAWWLTLHGGVFLLPVTILQLDEDSSASRTAARLLRSELDLAGFDTFLVTVDDPTAPGEVTEARRSGVELLEDMGEGALVDTSQIEDGYVEMAWQPSGAGGVRWRRIPVRNRERLTSLALEVAEFLNPLLMESQRLHGEEPERDEDEDEDEADEEADDESASPDEEYVHDDRRFWWGLGPTLVVATDGLPPALGPAAVVGVGLTSEIALEIDLAGTVALSRFSDPRGNAHTGSLHGHLHLVWSPRVSFPVGPRVGAGLGTAAIWADRPTEAAGSGSGIQFAFEGIVWAGARWHVTSDFILEPRVGASFAAPNLNLFVENESTGATESAASLGRPIVHASVLALFPL